MNKIFQGWKEKWEKEKRRNRRMEWWISEWMEDWKDGWKDGNMIMGERIRGRWKDYIERWLMGLVKRWMEEYMVGMIGGI